MEIVPRSVGVASRSWDEQHLDLDAAAGQVAQAPSGGFTPAVAGAADRFGTAWERHCRGLGQASEHRADTLRAVIRDHLAGDEASALALLRLSAFLAEVR